MNDPASHYWPSQECYCGRYRVAPGYVMAGSRHVGGGHYESTTSELHRPDACERWLTADGTTVQRLTFTRDPSTPVPE